MFRRGNWWLLLEARESKWVSYSFFFGNLGIYFNSVSRIVTIFVMLSAVALATKIHSRTHSMHLTNTMK